LRPSTLAGVYMPYRGYKRRTASGAKEEKESEEKHDRPRQEASDPERAPAPDDEVEPGTQGAAEGVCPECSGSGRLDGEGCPNCNGMGVVIRAVGGGG
jgi:hypothetical protein